MATSQLQSDVDEPSSTGKIGLDDKTIEANTAHYSEKVHEPILWAAAYCRERCNGLIPILVERCKKLKFNITCETWERIFTGKYFVKKEGKIGGSIDNFLRTVEELRKNDRLAWRAGRMPFIETPTWHDIEQFITRKRQPGRVNKFGAIIGPTGSQKSESFKHYCVLNNHAACKHIEAPEKPSLGQFITELAFTYGIARGQTTRKKIDGIVETVNEHKTIIIDNVQRLYMPDREGNQPLFNFCQKLQDDTGCTIIFSWTPDFTDILSRGKSRGYFEQFVGRMGGLNRNLVLPDYATREDILCIAEACGLKDAAKHIEYLEKITREPGRIRILFEDLQDAMQLAAADGQDLTITHIRQARGEE